MTDRHGGSQNMNKYSVALSTAGSESEAQDLARSLIARGAAACVTIIPKAISYYKWKGDLCEEVEWLMIIKTIPDRQGLIEQIFREMHSYEVPELIMLPIESGKQEYLDWLGASLMANE
jgi:periplasmic divalent cation tolerance protein